MLTLVIIFCVWLILNLVVVFLEAIESELLTDDHKQLLVELGFQGLHGSWLYQRIKADLVQVGVYRKAASRSRPRQRIVTGLHQSSEHVVGLKRTKRRQAWRLDAHIPILIQLQAFRIKSRLTILLLRECLGFLLYSLHILCNLEDIRLHLCQFLLANTTVRIESHRRGSINT